VPIAPATTGAFLAVSVTASPDITVHLRVFDISRAATNRGTDVPAVRESQARTTPIQLLDVPTAPPFRSLVRIYDFNPAEGHAVRVNVYKFGGLIESAELALRPQPEMPNTLSTFPGYAQYDLSHLGDLGTNVRVEVVPLLDGLRFWAMASTTNNETQHVTLTTP
jgi:hypothetical protein